MTHFRFPARLRAKTTAATTAPTTAKAIRVPALGLALLAATITATFAVTPHTAFAQSGTSGPQISAPQPTQSELLERLQAGGLIMLIRHERTELPSRRDDYDRPDTDCRAQRNLSLAGSAGAKETGDVIRMLGIDVGRVMTSPMCRSAETARFMFGVDYELESRLLHHEPGQDSRRDLDAAEAELRALLIELAPGMPGTNIALISHGGNIFRATGLRISEGEIGVLELGEDGTINALGSFMGSDLSPYARRIQFEAEDAATQSNTE